MAAGRHRADRVRAAAPRQRAAHHHRRVATATSGSPSTLGNRMGRITPAGAITEFDIPTPDSQPRAIALGARRQRLVRRVRRRQDRPHHAAGRHHRVRDPDARQRPARAGRRPRRQHLVLRVQRQQDRAHHAGRRRSPSSRCRVPTAVPATSPPAPTAHVVRRAHRAAWTAAARRQPRRPHHDGRRGSPSSRCRRQTGSPINIAVGPDRNIWFTNGGKLGRVTPDGTITEFPLPCAKPARRA